MIAMVPVEIVAENAELYCDGKEKTSVLAFGKTLYCAHVYVNSVADMLCCDILFFFQGML